MSEKRHQSIYVILDTSEEMSREHLDTCTAGLSTVIERIGKEEPAAGQFDLTVIATSAPREPWLRAVTATSKAEFDGLPRGGARALGAAVSTALDLIETRKRQWQEAAEPFLRPAILIVTGGEPSESPADWTRVAQRAHAQDHLGISVLPVCLPKAEAHRFLEQLTLREALTLKEGRTPDLFTWLADCVITTQNSENFALADTRALNLTPSPSAWAVEDVDEDDDDDEFIEAWQAGGTHEHQD